MKLGTGLLLILSLASVAQAQPAQPSEAERQYAERLGSTLGSTSRVERVGFRWTADMDGPGVADAISTIDDSSQEAARGVRVRGVRVEVAGVVVRRLRLEDATAAQLFAARSELDTLGPVVGELRGDQVIFVHGEPVLDPAFARRALDAAWLGLPCSMAASQATFANLGSIDLVIATSIDGPLARSVHDADASARKFLDRSDGVTVVDHGPDAGLAVRLAHGTSAGLNARVCVAPGRAWIYTSGSDQRLAPMARYFSVLMREAVPPTTITAKTIGMIDAIGQVNPAADGSVEMAGPGVSQEFPRGDEITAEVSKQVRDAIDAEIRGLGVLSKQLSDELEAARSGKPVVVDRPLGD